MKITRPPNNLIQTTDIESKNTSTAKPAPKVSTADAKPGAATESEKLTRLGDLKFQGSTQQILLSKTPLKGDVSKLFPNVKALSVPDRRLDAAASSPKDAVGPCDVVGPCSAVGPCNAVGPCEATGPCD